MPHVACNELMPVSHFVHGMKMCLRKMPLHSLPYWYTVHEASRWTTTTKRNSSMLHECKFVESENCTTTLLSMAPPTFSNIQVVVVWKLQHAEQHLLQANVMKYVCCVSVRQLCPIADCVCHVEGKVSIFFACCIAMQLLNTNRLIDDALTNYHPQKNVFNFTMTLGCDGWWWWCVDCCNAVCITIEMAFHVRFMFDSGQPRFFVFVFLFLGRWRHTNNNKSVYE